MNEFFKMNFSKYNYLIFLLAFLYIMPLILVGEYYVDDMGRVLSGYGWEHAGRFLATYLMRVISLGGAIFNIFPFSLIISAAIYLFSGLVVVGVLGLEESSRFKSSALIILTSPFVLENLSYRYDGIFMALSIFIVMVPFIFMKNRLAFFMFSFFGIYIALGLFQVAAMVYFAMLSCVFLRYFLSNKVKDFIGVFIVSLLAFAIAFLAYKISCNLLHVDSPERGALIIFDANFLEIFSNRVFILKNRLAYLLLNGKYLYVFLPFIFVFMLSCIFYLLSEHGLIKKLFGIFVVIPSVLISIFLLIGMPNLVVNQPWWTSRTFLAYPFLIYAMLMMHDFARCRWLSKLTVLLLIYYSFLLSSVYGSSLNNKKEYTEYLIGQASSFLLKNNIKNIVISGRAPIPPRNILAYKEFPILNSLANIGESEGSYWGVKSFSRYHSYGWPKNRGDIVGQRCIYEIGMTSEIFWIRVIDDIAVIDFNYKKCFGNIVE